MANQVQTAVTSPGSLDPGLGRTFLFRNPRGQGLWYAIRQTSTPDELAIEESADGVNWNGSVVTIQASPGFTAWFDVVLFEDATNGQLVAHLAYGPRDQTNTSAITYRRIRIADSNSAITIGAASTIDAGGNNSNAYSPNLCLDQNNRLICAYVALNKNMGTTYYDIVLRGTSEAGVNIPDSPTWSAERLVTGMAPSAGADTNNSEKALVYPLISRYAAGTHTFSVFGRHGQTGTTGQYAIAVRDHGFNGTTFTEGGITTLVAPTIELYRLSMVADNRASPNSGVHLLSYVVNSTARDVNHWRKINNAAPTASTVFDTVSNSVRTAELACDLSASPPDVYCFFVIGNGDLRVSSTPADTISWSADSQVEDVGHVIQWLFTQDFNSNNSLHIGYKRGSANEVWYVEFALGGGGNVTLTADPGTYSITGAIADLLHNRVIAADPGSYAVSGTAAQLLRDLFLTADPGSYSVTGATAQLLRDLLITADPGSYSVTGTAAELLVSVQLTADPGTYLVSGTDAALLVSLLLAADPGSYAVAGTDATLLYNRAIAADPGSYLISGTDAQLLLDRILVADPGSYLITGTDATLTVSKVITAESGSYLVSGTAAQLLRDLILAADSGVYAHTGTDAGLLISINLVAEPGAYVHTGTDAQLLLDRILTAEPGIYSHTGSVAQLLLDRILTADPGSYVHLGTDATLSVGRVIIADPGSYLISGAAAQLLLDRILTADPGVYSISGSVAGLLRDLILTAESGVYSTAGTDAQLLVGRVIAAEGGSYIISGSVVTFLRDYVIVAEPGTYSVSGAVANLFVTGAGAIYAAGLEYSAVINRLHFTPKINRLHYTPSDEDNR